MKIRAIRGVCIGVHRHLAVGETTDVDTATFTFLNGIGAVELMTDVPQSEPKLMKPDESTTREKPGKKEKTL